MFLQDIDHDMERLASAINSQDVETLTNEAHTLKGVLASFQAEPARLAAFELEQSARSGHWDTAQLHKIFENIQHELIKLRPALRTYLAAQS